MSMTARPNANMNNDTLLAKSVNPCKGNQELSTTNPTQVTLPGDESSIYQNTTA